MSSTSPALATNKACHVSCSSLHVRACLDVSTVQRLLFCSQRHCLALHAQRSHVRPVTACTLSASEDKGGRAVFSCSFIYYSLLACTTRVRSAERCQQPPQWAVLSHYKVWLDTRYRGS